ncbi:hypothetical protein J437_LFUL012212 [Ladona fulva]|uniref:Uncharacterized protein n=1 Tax=Ladona fulva TaxID=123851 RepID=A0A8K0P4A0_LADFU|nr:hypothetical protein J437_LFUL012212 [Ladona fulva]
MYWREEIAVTMRFHRGEFWRLNRTAFPSTVIKSSSQKTEYKCPREYISGPHSSKGSQLRLFRNVSTGVGRLSHLFHLHVVVPEALILGSSDYHVGEGSAISLVCIIENKHL